MSQKLFHEMSPASGNHQRFLIVIHLQHLNEKISDLSETFVG